MVRMSKIAWQNSSKKILEMNKSEAQLLARRYQSLPTFSPLVLPLPTSKNNLHTRGNKRGWHTRDYKQFRRDTAIEFKLWHRENPGFEEYRGSRTALILTFDYQVFTPSGQGDVMNYSQALLDALESKKDKRTKVVTRLAWANDAYINLRLIIPNDPIEMIDKMNPRCVLNLNPSNISVVKTKRKIAEHTYRLTNNALCPECGGRTHKHTATRYLCPNDDCPTKTFTPSHEKRGAKPKGDRPMTGAERARKYRNKKKT